MRKASLYSQIRLIDKRIQDVQEEILDLHVRREKMLVDEKMTLDDTAMKLGQQIKALENQLKKLGPINFQAEDSFHSSRKEFRKWQKQKNSLLSDIKRLAFQVGKLEKIRKSEFLSGFKKISQLFSHYSEKLSGGNVECELLLKLQEKATRPKFRIRVKVRGTEYPLSSLSIGERAILAISFAFALQGGSRSGIVLQDEVDVHLDQETTKRLGEVLLNRSLKQQFVITTLKPEIVKLGDEIFGAYQNHEASHVMRVRFHDVLENNEFPKRSITYQNKIFIKRVEVRDFMSHKNSVLELSPGLNVITGPNGSGKTGLLLAILHCIGSDIFRKNTEVLRYYHAQRSQAEFAEITLVFDNQTHELPIDADEVTITRKTFRKRSIWELNGRKVPKKDIRQIARVHFPFFTPQRFTMDAFSRIMKSSHSLLNFLEEFVGVHNLTIEITQKRTLLEKKKEKIRWMEPIIDSYKGFLKRFEVEKEKLIKWKRIKKQMESSRRIFESHTKTNISKKLSKKENLLDKLKGQKEKLIEKVAILEGASRIPAILRKYYHIIDESALSSLVSFLVNVVLKKRMEREPLGICFVVLKEKKIPKIFDDLKEDFVEIPPISFTKNWNQVIPLLDFLDPSIRCLAVGPEGTILGTLTTPTFEKALNSIHMEFLFAEKEDIPHVSISLHAKSLVMLKQRMSNRIKIFDRGILMAEYVNNTWKSISSGVKKKTWKLKNAFARIKEDLELKHDLLNVILDIAISMSYQHFGAIFMIGDHKNVLAKSSEPSLSQLIKLKKCSVNDLRKDELVNLAKHDGATIIDNRGTLRLVGAILRPKPETVAEVYPSDGARHTSAAKVTAETRALAIVVSHDGPISIYHKGKRLLKEG